MAKKTMDGNTAAAYAAYAFSDAAAIYPITPSSPMAENCDEWAAVGKKNIFGEVMRIAEMQSEGGAAGAVHGSLAAGAFTSTFTASQGLLLMIPNMYKISGELLPCVFHVTARALAAHALSIFGDHSDVMSTRQTGFAMMASNSVQEVLDLAAISHLATVKAKVPFLHYFDGFRTSHEISKIEVPEYSELAELLDMDAVADFRARAMNPEHPHQQGTAQNPDIYFQNREAANKYYAATPAIVQEVMDEYAKKFGRQYKLFDYSGAPDAEYIAIAMCSGCEVIEEYINYANARGAKLGLVKVRLYRPFSAKHLVAAIPETVKGIAVLDRTKEPGSLGEPLYEDVVTALFESGRMIKTVGGRYGLGSKEFNPTMVKAVFDNLASAEPKNHFTVGINDDVTHTSLELGETVVAAPEGCVSCMFYGLGSDGTVGANKRSIKLIGDNTDMFAQGYFVYDSKKSGGITISHLRFGNHPIQSEYLIDSADFVACHNPSYITRYDMLSAVKDGGVFLLNSPWTLEEMESEFPAEVKRQIAAKKLRFYNIDAIKHAADLGLGGFINMIMQAAFFKVSGVMDIDRAEQLMKDVVRAHYSRKGDDVVNMNIGAIDAGLVALEEINYPEEWATATTGAVLPEVTDDKYFCEVVKPILKQQGDALPVSAFDPRGFVPTGTTQYEKRGTAINLPVWLPENCIQCNQCSFVCPHACIRPFISEGETPESYVTIPAKNKAFAGKDYRIQLSPLDCTGCGNCAQVCPAKEKALVMAPAADVEDKENANWKFAETLPEVKGIDPYSVINSQFVKPLFEFSGACGGCGETPYIKLATQLFGDRMLIANATGCSSIYGGNAPTCPYTVNAEGHGPTWANSLFEDNAEFGYGMNLAVQKRRETLKALVEKLVELPLCCEEYCVDNFKSWLENFNDGDGSAKWAEQIKKKLPKLLEKAPEEAKAVLAEIDALKDYLAKKSVWIIGGDGWAYDIGYGGLDHVLAMNEDVNILVLDTEVYSNTGGQSSKATPTGSTAKFAAAGKRTKKKDLGAIAMTYGYVYVASVAMGANRNQLVKAMKKAESYHGPSIIIAYAPCINHGIDMSKTQETEKNAVESGYWPLYRFDPRRADEGKNPFVLDCSDPTKSYLDFINKETRYKKLKKQFPGVAGELFEQAAKEAAERFEAYKKRAED